MTTKEMIAISLLRRVSTVSPWGLKAHKIANGGTVDQKRELIEQLYSEGKEAPDMMCKIITTPAWEAVVKCYEPMLATR